MNMNNFTLCLLLLLILAILNNLIMYTSYIYSYTHRDPLLPDNIGVVHYDVYYNINTSINKDEDGILKTNYKYKIDKYMNKLYKENIHNMFIKNAQLDHNDYEKILKLSQLHDNI